MVRVRVAAVRVRVAAVRERVAAVRVMRRTRVRAKA